MRESGYYPEGAEYDPRAPYNQGDQDEVEVDVCISQTLHRNTTITTADYIAEKWEDCEMDEDGRYVRTGGVTYDFSDSDLLGAYKDREWTIDELLNELQIYIQKELENCDPSKTKWLQSMLQASKEWVVDEEEVINE